MTQPKDNDRLFCLEQVVMGNPSFRVSRVFAPPDLARKLLPLYAVFSAVEQIVSRGSDESVARTKLNWWREESLHRKMSNSRHPVLREMCRTGAAERINRQSLECLLNEAEKRLDPALPSDLDSLKVLASGLYLPQIELELAVCGVDSGSTEIGGGFKIQGGILQLVRESLRSGQSNRFWWIPLNLLARHGVGRADVARLSDHASLPGMFSELFAACRDPSGLTLSKEDHGNKSLLPARHLFAMHGLNERKIRRMEKLKPAAYGAEVNRAGLAELICAWQSARRLR